MKTALIADIHSNIEALEACLDHARTFGATRFAFLGDLMGYNADPVAVLDRVQGLVDDGAALAVLGNHDAAVLGRAGAAMGGAAAEVTAWTQRKLHHRHLSFLERLPLTVREGEKLYVHANAGRPDHWGYVSDGLRAAASLEAGQATYVFCGHVHEAVLYYLGADHRPQPFVPVPGVSIPVARHRQWLAIVGACGQPRDGRPGARYALLDEEHHLLTFFRVPYDFAASADKVRRAGLPEEFARRLETGD